MKRSGRLRSDPAKTRAWQDRSRKRLPQQSDRRKAEQPERDATRQEVLRRAGWQCQYRDLVPWVRCATRPGRRDLEVDELRGGAQRSTEYLDPEQCRATCPAHHDYKTEHKHEVLGLLAAAERRP